MRRVRARVRCFVRTALALLGLSVAAHAQQAYLGYVFPAGGRQGDTIRVDLGGQRINGIHGIRVSGSGVEARIVEFNRRLRPQEVRILREQLRDLQPRRGRAPAPEQAERIDRLERLLREHVNQPACGAIADRVIAEIAIAPDAPPGRRELRVETLQGVSNPMVFHVGDLPEVSRPALPTSPLAILGKEGDSLRRPSEEEIGTCEGGSLMEALRDGARPPSLLDRPVLRIPVPSTANGQISAGTVNRYRFTARKGQRLVVQVRARELIPYIADAVPGWFQAVVRIRNAEGRELACEDDYRFDPDPVLFFEPPADGEYLLEIHDAIYRGREDFVYRVSIGELPFVTNRFPLGGPAGARTELRVDGWNLTQTRLPVPLPADAPPGIHLVSVRGRGGLLSNPLPFALDTLPEILEREPNDGIRTAQRVTLPVIVNGRIDRSGDWDVFRFEGRAGETLVAEVLARRLGSPLDSVLMLTDASGTVIAYNDDFEDPGSGLNTHHADSYIRVQLPEDGAYYVHLGDIQRGGGSEYAYRLRLGSPRPDFELRAEPSRLTFRPEGRASLNVHVIRRDGFDGPVRLALKDPPEGFELIGGGLVAATQDVSRVTFRTTLKDLEAPVVLSIEGVATNGADRIARVAVAAEDRMQAFLWRHLVPAGDLQAVVVDPASR